MSLPPSPLERQSILQSGATQRRMDPLRLVVDKRIGGGFRFRLDDGDSSAPFKGIGLSKIPCGASSSPLLCKLATDFELGSGCSAALRSAKGNLGVDGAANLFGILARPGLEQYSLFSSFCFFVFFLVCFSEWEVGLLHTLELGAAADDMSSFQGSSTSSLGLFFRGGDLEGALTVRISANRALSSLSAAILAAAAVGLKKAVRVPRTGARPGIGATLALPAALPVIRFPLPRPFPHKVLAGSIARAFDASRSEAGASRRRCPCEQKKRTKLNISCSY